MQFDERNNGLFLFDKLTATTTDALLANYKIMRLVQDSSEFEV
jgi:hypothetical protein